jgi:hypothetical protein
MRAFERLALLVQKGVPDRKMRLILLLSLKPFGKPKGFFFIQIWDQSRLISRTPLEFDLLDRSCPLALETEGEGVAARSPI